MTWHSAGTYRTYDGRGGATNGARIRLAPQKDWAINKASGVAAVIKKLESVQADFDGNVSIADLIVLGGNAAIEDVSGIMCLLRRDAAMRSKRKRMLIALKYWSQHLMGSVITKTPRTPRSTETLLVDRAQLLGLTAPEMTVLVAGLRTLGANADGGKHGVFVNEVGTLSNEGLKNLLDISTQWKATDASEETFEGRDQKTGKVKYTGTRADLVFGSNSILRGLAEFYAESDSKEKFVTDFIAAWNKVMNADRFDLSRAARA